MPTPPANTLPFSSKWQYQRELDLLSKENSMAEKRRSTKRTKDPVVLYPPPLHVLLFAAASYAWFSYALKPRSIPVISVHSSPSSMTIGPLYIDLALSTRVDSFLILCPSELVTF